MNDLYYHIDKTGMILGWQSVNERRRYKVINVIMNVIITFATDILFITTARHIWQSR